MTNSTIAYQWEHASDDAQPTLRIVTGVMWGVATLSMLLRFIARRVKNSRPSGEDWAMIIGWVFTTVFCALMYVTVDRGFGRHTVLVKDVKSFTISLLSLEVMYNPAIVCIKGSILILYNHLFSQKSLRHVSWAIWILVVTYSIVQFFCELFVCYPIAKSWDPTLPGKCVRLSTVVTTCSIINIVTDVVILSLPIPYLWRLNMSTIRKVQLIGIFSLGGVVCIISIYRATQLHTVSLEDPAWADVNGALWSGIELSVAIVSGNLPVMRPIYNELFKHNESTDSVLKSHGPRPGHMSYPDLRPGQLGHEAKVSQGVFERLGSATDAASVEMNDVEKRRKIKHNAIVVRTEVNQQFS
ncbi:MAG: hypothetical protein M1818_002616 [Claussenomyces sp. TS43310]|nr:MAG: hypothetical protein M1818_002616 [Claussenomyces sp. TS43310]